MRWEPVERRWLVRFCTYFTNQKYEMNCKRIVWIIFVLLLNKWRHRVNKRIRCGFYSSMSTNSQRGVNGVKYSWSVDSIVKLGNHYHLLFVCFFYSNWFVPWRLFFQIYRIEWTHWPNWHWFHVFCFVFSLSSVEIICDRFPLNFVFALQTLNHLLHTVNWAMNSLKARQFKLINIDKKKWKIFETETKMMNPTEPCLSIAASHNLVKLLLCFSVFSCNLTKQRSLKLMTH